MRELQRKSQCIITKLIVEGNNLKRLSASRNAMFGLLGWLIPLGFTFALTPFIVHGLGPASYGLYVLVMGVIGYLTSLNFNVGRALTRYVSTFQAKTETDQIGEVLSSTLWLYLLIGIITAGCMLLLSNWLIKKVLNIAPALQPEAKLAISWAAVVLVFTFLSQVFGAIPQALQRFDLYAVVIALSGVAILMGNAVMVWLRLSVSAMVAWVALVACLASLAFILISRRLLPGVHLTRHFRRPLLFELLRFSVAVTAYQVFGNLLVLFERGWLTRRLGAETVSYYVVPMTIATYIHSFIASITLVIFPIVSEANALGDKARLERTYTRACKYVSILVVFAVVTLVISGQRLLSEWMGANFASKTAGVLKVHANAMGLVAMGIVPWQLADGLGFPKWNAFLALFWLITAAFITVWLTPFFGILAPAWGRLVAVLSVPAYALFVEHRVFGHSLWKLWRKMAFSLVLAGGLTAAVQYIIQSRSPLIGWTVLLVSVASSGLVYLSVLCIVDFVGYDERAQLRCIFARLMTQFTVGQPK